LDIFQSFSAAGDPGKSAFDFLLALVDDLPARFEAADESSGTVDFRPSAAFAGARRRTAAAPLGGTV
jgi:hypothetical protein